MKNLPLPKQSYLLEALKIDETSPSGLRWNWDRPREHFETERGFRIFKTRDGGNCAGHIGKSGDGHKMWIVKIAGKRYQAHRVVFCMKNGDFDPSYEVDHIDRDPLNNEPKNLRLSTRAQNASNKSIPSNNTSSARGVTWDKKNRKWQAQIGHFGKCIFLGRFSSKEEAVAARVAGSQRLHGEFRGIVSVHHEATQ